MVERPASGRRAFLRSGCADDVADRPFARYVADPFVAVSDGASHLFFEVFYDADASADVGHATSDDGIYLFVQDVARTYGDKVRCFEVTTLTEGRTSTARSTRRRPSRPRARAGGTARGCTTSTPPCVHGRDERGARGRQGPLGELEHRRLPPDRRGRMNPGAPP